MSHITEPSHPFSRDCDAFGNCRNSTVVSLLLAWHYFHLQDEVRGHNFPWPHNIFDWDLGRECCRWGRIPILHPWPHCWSGCSKVEHSSHTWWPCCRRSSQTKTWNLCLANQGLPNYHRTGGSRPGDEQQQPQGCEVSLLRGRVGAVPRCATGPAVKPIVGRTPLRWGRGWRKESWALICSICSAAANWIEGAEGKTLDTALGTWSLQFPWTKLLQHCCPAPLPKPFLRAQLLQYLPIGGAELNIGNTTQVNPFTLNKTLPTAEKKRLKISFLYQKPAEHCKCQVLFRCKSQKLACQLPSINITNTSPTSATFILHQWLDDVGLLLFKDSAQHLLRF